MKSIVFKNKLNGEQVVCDNIKLVETIDGVEYLLVRRYASDRQFLMRKDVLEKVVVTKKEKIK